MRPKHALIIVIGLGTALALTPVARPQDGRGPFDGLQAHYWPHRKLGIPIDAQKLGGLENKPTHLQLYYSLKRGPFQKGPKLPLDGLDVTDSGRKGIVFEAPRDGDYEFAVQHVYADGKLRPATDALAPELRIIVDTTAPRVQIAPSGNGVEWRATDENIDPTGIVVQCKWPATNEWTNVKNVVADRPFPTSGTYGWKFQPGEALDVRVKARDRAGHEGVSPVVRVPAESGTPVGFPKGPAWGGDPAPPLPESRIDYVNTLDFNFDYTVQHMGRSGVRASHLFVQKDRSPWEFVKKQPENLMPGGKEPHSITLSYKAPNEGIYGFYIIPESGAGKRADDPKKDDPPMMLVVDTTKPQVEITSVQVKPGGVKGPIVEITWRATDSNLMPRPVNLEWSSDREATKWNEIKYRLDNDLTATTGRYAWEVPDEKLWQFYVRARAVDKAANAGENIWGQQVIVDLEKPSGTIDRVRGGAGSGAGTPAPKSDAPLGTPAPKSPSPGKPIDNLLP